jgi:phage tail-like protein
VTFSAARTLTAADWRSWGRCNVAVVGDGVVLQSSPAIEQTELPIDAVDLALDDEGAVYALGPSGTLTRHDREQGIEQRLWQPGPRSAFEPAAVCVAGDRAYVADRSGGRLVAISTRLQRQIGTIETGLATPVELATAGGSVLALDAGFDGLDGRLVRVGPAGQGEPVLDDLCSPLDLLVTGDLEGWVLEDCPDGPRLRSIDGERSLSLSSLRLASSGESLTPTRLARADAGTLVLGCRASDGEFVLCTYEPGESIATERHRQGSSWRSLVGEDDGPLYAAVEDGSCLELAATERYSTEPGTARYRGEVLGRLDAGVDEVQWHRLTLDLGRSASGTQVRVRYLATDEPSVGPPALSSLEGVADDDVAALSAVGVTSVWELASSDPEILAADVPSVTTEEAAAWRRAADDAIVWRTVDDPDPTDVLLEGATGRYLHVAVELRGTRTTSPRVNAIEAFCPRQSYLRYLPDLYQEDEVSAAFLERFLSIFESTFSDVEREIETITRYFDPGGVPSDSLEWLASWLAVDVDDAWPESARRELLARAPSLYKKRGTRVGLREMIELYLRHVEPPAPIPDRERPAAERPVAAGRSGRQVANADGGIDHGGGSPHELFVLEHRDLDGVESTAAREPFERALAGPQSFAVYAGPFARDDHCAAVERIVEREAPAHTCGDVVSLEQSFELAGNTFLGVNSTLIDRELELGQTALGGNAVLRGETDESR